MGLQLQNKTTKQRRTETCYMSPSPLLLICSQGLPVLTFSLSYRTVVYLCMSKSKVRDYASEAHKKFTMFFRHSLPLLFCPPRRLRLLRLSTTARWIRSSNLIRPLSLPPAAASASAFFPSSLRLAVTTEEVRREKRNRAAFFDDETTEAHTHAPWTAIYIISISNAGETTQRLEGGREGSTDGWTDHPFRPHLPRSSSSFLLSAASIISNILPLLPAKVEPPLRLSLSSKAVSPSPSPVALSLSHT